jgi:hypothetical protein
MIKPWFLTEGKSCCCIHHTFLLGFPTGWSFNYTPPTLFWRNQPAITPLSGFKPKSLPPGEFVVGPARSDFSRPAQLQLDFVPLTVFFSQRVI